MNSKEKNVSKERKKRSTFSEMDKKIFVNIMRTGEGGKFWKQIVESKGKTTIISRHDLWQNVAELFSEATGRHFESKQVKDMWHRIKSNTKAKHDQKFKTACAKTGGGIGPDKPEDEDGDEDLLDFSDLDPTNTKFNSLVRPEERQPLTFGQSSSTHPLAGALSSSVSASSSSYRAGSSNGFGPRFRFPGNPSPFRFASPKRFPSPELSPSSVPSSRSSSTQQHSPISSQAQIFQGVTPLSTASETSESISQGQIEIVRGDGSTEFVEAVVTENPDILGEIQVEIETPKSSDKRSKKATPKGSNNMNDAATNYYVNMLEIQKELAQKQMEVLERKVCLLRSREENEKLKAKILKKQLGDVETEESGLSEDSDDESDMTVNQAEFSL